MKCEKCSRELREDSKFCDCCGHSTIIAEQTQTITEFNTSALLAGILISVLITIIISGSVNALGVPLFFGGLFLPFFWKKIKK